MKKEIAMTCALCVTVFFPVVAQAKIEFTEVMYDPAGTDTGREWVEIHNTANDTVDIGGLRLFEEGVSHVLKPVVGTSTLAGGQYAVIADDPAKFAADWSTYSGTLFDSSFSLKNTGEPLVLRGKDADEDSITYDPTIGGAGDGNSLQKQLSVDGVASWVAALPTPGLGRTPAVSTGVVVDVAPGPSVSSGSGSATSTSGTSTTTPEVATVESSGAQSAPAVSVSANVSMKYIPVEPQIFCKINGKNEVFAGVESTFSAQGWGLKKLPLQNARYVWNFGDGQTKEGQYVLHTYSQPGTYELFLETASDVYSATDRLKVTVRLPQVALSHSAETIVIENHDVGSIDLFGLKLSQDGRPDFTFPEHSMISGHGEMNIDAVHFSQTYAEVSRADEAPITLEYVNGRVLATSTPREIKAAVKKPVAKSAVKSTGVKVAKPKAANVAAQRIGFVASSGGDQVIVLDTTAKERRLNYYGATIGVLALLAFAWWYLLR